MQAHCPAQLEYLVIDGRREESGCRTLHCGPTLARSSLTMTVVQRTPISERYAAQSLSSLTGLGDSQGRQGMDQPGTSTLNIRVVEQYTEK